MLPCRGHYFRGLFSRHYFWGNQERCFKNALSEASISNLYLPQFPSCQFYLAIAQTLLKSYLQQQYYIHRLFPRQVFNQPTNQQTMIPLFQSELVKTLELGLLSRCGSLCVTSLTLCTMEMQAAMKRCVTLATTVAKLSKNIFFSSVFFLNQRDLIMWMFIFSLLPALCFRI